MSALRALRVARAAGVGVDLNGDRLRLTAASPPPPDVLQAIAEHKDTIVALLEGEAGTHGGWDRDDWRCFYDERSGIAEHDGHLQRHHAEDMAFEVTVVEYMNRTFAPSSPDRCLGCGEGDRVQDVLLPYGIESRGHCWLHAGCWPDWDAHRTAVAVDVLAKFGIAPRPLLTADDKQFIDEELGT